MDSPSRASRVHPATRIIVSTALLLGLECLNADPAPAQSAARVGAEFQVNENFMHFDFFESAEAVAIRNDGSFVVIWRSPYPTGIFARRFDAMGVRQALEFRIDSATASAFSPALATLSDGSFVVAWESWSYYGVPPGRPDIVARRFDADGTPQATEFLVNSYTSGDQTEPAIAIDGGGDFVVVWRSEGQDGDYAGLFGQRFDGSGSAQSSEFQINASTSKSQLGPAVAMDQDGDFVVTWSSSDQAVAIGAFGRRFDAAGIPQGSEFEIDPTTPGSRWPLVAMHPDGDFVVIWARPLAGVGGRSLFGRRFDAAGSTQATEFEINSYTPAFLFDPAIAMSKDGDFVVTWSSDAIFARRFDRSATSLTDTFQVTSPARDLDLRIAAALDVGGRFVIVWSRLQYCQFPCHGQSGDVFAQRFTSHAAPLDIDSDGSLAGLTDGLLVLRFLFDLTGPALSDGAVGVSCARCTSSTIEAHLETLDTLDVDGDGVLDPLTDGILILRFLFGFHGDALTSGAVGSECVRCDATAIEPYLAGLTSTSG
jgi:hypothetical protein